MRGTVGIRAGYKEISGITPACAGNRKISENLSGVRKDHPRVCGEQMTACIDGRGLAGSPPRVRGTVAKVVEQVADLGITPACAGNRVVM